MKLGQLFDWFVKLVPAAVLFSAFFALDGGLRWIGLFGVIPLLFAFQKGCPSCSIRHRRGDGAPDTWPTFVGH